MKSFIKSVLSSFFGFVLAVALFFGLVTLAVRFGSSSRSADDIPKDFSYIHLKLPPEIHEYNEGGLLLNTALARLVSGSVPLTLLDITQAIREAARDDRIKSILLDLTDYDANWAITDSIRTELSNFIGAGKNVYSYSTNYNEKKYYLASVSNKVILMPHGALDLSGLSLTVPYFRKLLDRFEVKPILVREGKFKSAGEVFVRPEMSAEQNNQLSSLLTDFWTQVQEEIEVSRKEVAAVFNDKVTKLEFATAEDGLKTKLVDELKYQDELKAELGGEGVDLFKYLTLLSQELKLRPKDKNVGIVFATGDIVSGAGRADQIATQNFEEIVERTLKDESVSAVVLRIDSPGGDAIASEHILRLVQKLNEKKPVVASFGGTAASGGYYIAAGAQLILADPFTITGSIGVFGLIFNTGDLFSKTFSTKIETVKTHPSADLAHGLRDLTPGEHESIQRSISSVYDRFKQVVSEGRGHKVSDVESVAQGRVWSGWRAKEVGLVDDFGGIFEAVDEAARIGKMSEGYGIKVLNYEDEWLEFINDFTSIFGSAQAGWTEKFQKVLPERIQNLKTGLHLLEPRVFDIR